MSKKIKIPFTREELHFLECLIRGCRSQFMLDFVPDEKKEASLYVMKIKVRRAIIKHTKTMLDQKRYIKLFEWIHFNGLYQFL